MIYQNAWRVLVPRSLPQPDESKSLIAILFIVLPVFLVVGTGYVVVRTGYLGADLSDHLNNYAVRLAVPVLLFDSMYRVDFQQAFHPRMLAAFYVGAFAAFFIAVLLARVIWKRRPGESVAVGFCAFFSNTVILGLSIVERAFGETVLAPAIGIISFHAPVTYAAGMIMMELSRRDGRPLRETLRTACLSIASNPLMIGVVAGVACNLSGLQLPGFLLAATGMVAASAIPAALVGIGAALTRYQIKGEIGESLMVTVLSLVLHPLIAFALSWGVFALDPIYVRAAVIIAAMPPGMNGYIFAVMYDRAVPTAASSILIATALSILTISAWILLLRIAGI